MPTKWYRKELPTQPIWINGSPVKFDVLQTSDPVMIANLDAAIANQRGGIIAITKEEFDVEDKKKASGKPSDNGSPRNHRQELSAPNRNLAAVAASDIARAQSVPPNIRAAMAPGGQPGSPVNGRPMPDPIMVPSANQFQGLLSKPTTAKITPP